MHNSTGSIRAMIGCTTWCTRPTIMISILSFCLYIMLLVLTSNLVTTSSIHHIISFRLLVFRLPSPIPQKPFHVDKMTDWAKLVEEKRSSRANQIPNEWHISRDLLKDVNEDSDHSAFEILNQLDLLSKEERHITEDYSARDLCAELASGRLSAVGVCSAFCHRAAVAQQLVSRVPTAFNLDT